MFVTQIARQNRLHAFRPVCAARLLPLLLLASLVEASAQPAIISTIPSQMATGVPTNTPIVFTFSKAMNTTPTVTFAAFSDSSLLANNPSGQQPVTSSWNASNTMLTCTPVLGFPTNKTIVWTVVGSDPAGNPLQFLNPALLPGGFFTTGSVSEGTNAQPLILSTVPINNGPMTSSVAPVIFTFNKPINTSVTTAFFYDINVSAVLPTIPVWSASNMVLTCTPYEGYPFPTNHTIQWSVSGTDLPGDLLCEQSGYFEPGPESPDTNTTSFFSLIEACTYDQASAGAPTLYPPGNGDGAYVFGVNALVASNFPVSSISLTLPNNSVAELWDSVTANSFLMSEGITALASFDATFPSGNYVFNIQGTAGTQQVTVNFPSGLIQPNAPHINNFTNAQAVNPTLPFLLSWDPFQNAGTADIVVVAIGTPAVFTSATVPGTNTSVLIPAGTFQPNGHYDAWITFLRSTTNTINSTNLATVGLSAMTHFFLTTTTNSIGVVSGVGVRTNRFGFNVAGISNLVVVVEACTNLANPVWCPLQTNTLTGAPFYFIDPHWTNYPRRFYRLRSP
jgi:hypothetical protein